MVGNIEERRDTAIILLTCHWRFETKTVKRN